MDCISATASAGIIAARHWYRRTRKALFLSNVTDATNVTQELTRL